MKKSVKFTMMFLLGSFIAFLACKHLFYPVYVKYELNKYYEFYDKYLDNFEFALELNPASKWDIVVYLKEYPEINSRMNRNYIRRFQDGSYKASFISKINEFRLSSLVFDDFDHAISSIIGNPEIDYLMHFQLRDSFEERFDEIVENDPKAMYDLLSSDKFRPYLEIKIIFDENEKEIHTIDINHFHEELYLFTKEYFAQIGVETMEVYFQTCYSSSFVYYNNYPFHLECGFIQRDMELLNNNIVFHEKIK